MSRQSDLHFIASGVGPPVVLLHGLASSCRTWEGFIPVLEEAGYQALSLDLLGHGDSAKPDNRQAYQAESLYSHFERWLFGMDLHGLPTLIGHSLGGYLSLAFAARHPERVRGLVLLDPLYTPAQIPPPLRLLLPYAEWGEKALQAAPRWLIRLASGLEPYDARFCTRNTHFQAAEDLKRASRYILHIPASLPDLTPRLGQITLPVQVIWGEKDLTLDPASFTCLVEALPNATGHMICGRGHKPHLSHPGETHRLILDFLSALPPDLPGSALGETKNNARA